MMWLVVSERERGVPILQYSQYYTKACDAQNTEKWGGWGIRLGRYYRCISGYQSFHKHILIIILHAPLPSHHTMFPEFIYRI